MEKLYSWSIIRSGASMTIAHSCGKITGVVRVEPRDGAIVAFTSAGRTFVLHVPEAG